MISVLILTLNEEINLPVCMESVSWSDDIVVLDSFSTDRTVEIAKEFGARVIQRKFDNWAAHQNWAVDNIEFKYPWVFYIDADERCDAKLKEELLNDDPERENYCAYQVRRKDYFMGKWLKHAQFYPTWITRVFKPDKIRYERLVNPIALVEGKTGQLQGHLIHYPFSHGISHWFEKHNNYSSHEAVETLKDLDHGAIDYKGLLSSDPVRRRIALKHLSFRMPGRPFMKFAYMYLLRAGFLDGRAGLTYCTLQAIYEYMICCKVKELRRRKNGQTV